MDRTAGSRFAHAASLSSTSALASSAALSALGSVVKTSSASVMPALLACPGVTSWIEGAGGCSALLQPRQGGCDGAGSLQTLLGHPADHLGPAGGEDAQPAAHGQAQESAVQLDPDLLVLVLRQDVLDEQDAQLSDVGLRLRRDGRHRAGRKRQLEVGVHRLAGLEG